MRVALLANLAQNAPTWPGMPAGQWQHLDSWQTIDAITGALEQAGHQVIFLEGDQTLYNNLQAVAPDICFNLCQGHFGHTRMAQVPAILEMLGLPYTGSEPLPLILGLDTALTWRNFVYHGLPTPPFQVFDRVDDPANLDWSFPFLLKPSRGGSPQPFKAGLRVHNREQLEDGVRQLVTEFAQPVMATQGIEGREIIVGLVGNLPAPAARQVPQDQASAALFTGLHILPPVEIKAGTTQTLVCPAPLTEPQLERLQWLAAVAFRVMGCRDVAQVTFCFDPHDSDKLWLVDVNPLPSLAFGHALLQPAAQAAGWNYEMLVNRILDAASKRYQDDGRWRHPRSFLINLRPMFFR